MFFLEWVVVIGPCAIVIQHLTEMTCTRHVTILLAHVSYCFSILLDTILLEDKTHVFVSSCSPPPWPCNVYSLLFSIVQPQSLQRLLEQFSSFYLRLDSAVYNYMPRIPRLAAGNAWSQKHRRLGTGSQLLNKDCISGDDLAANIAAV